MVNVENKLSYRAEIDGLRAIAVIGVILYHAEMIFFGRDWFEGGYIGVDVFFVISGYLITRIIFLELYQKNSFNFLKFYERRARRILPVLFVVVFASIPFAWVKLLSSDLVEYANSVLASIFFSSNFFFYYTTTEYGADSALLKPFLHTWSLGVEEQFYLVFPVFAIVSFRLCREYILIALAVLIAASLIFSELMEVRNSDLNFYLPFSRFWELAVGSALAYNELNKKNERNVVLTKFLPALGLCLIIFSMFFFGQNTPHPGFYTIFPILGAALIISFSSNGDVVGKFLSWKPLVWIGLISYSAYLWHFPVFAFRRYSENSLDNLDKLELIFLTSVLSIVSYFLVEKVFRNREVVSSRIFVWLLFISLIIIFTMIYFTNKNNGYSERFELSESFSNYEVDNKKLRRAHSSIYKKSNNNNRVFDDVPHKILIVGNSHAIDMFNVLFQNKNNFNDHDFLVGDYARQLSCFDEAVEEYGSNRSDFYSSKNYLASTVIIVSTRYGLARRCNKNRKYEVTGDDFKGLSFLIKRAKKDNKIVIVMGNSPEFSMYKDKIVADYIYDTYKYSDLSFGEIKDVAGSLIFKKMSKRKLVFSKKAEKIAIENNVNFLDKLEFVCSVKFKSCDVYTDSGYKTFFDYGHYTLEGAQYFGKRLAGDSLFRALLEGK